SVALHQLTRCRREALGSPTTLAHTGRNDATPDLAFQMINPADLIVPSRKLRKAESAHVRQVADAIGTLGFCDPVLVTAQNRVIDGAVRVEAAKLLGLGAIPCILADHLDQNEQRLLRLALNRLQERGSWDLEELRLEVQELILEDVTIEVAGFSSAEIDQILIEDDPAPVEPGPLTPASGPAKACVGDYLHSRTSPPHLRRRLRSLSSCSSHGRGPRPPAPDCGRTLQCSDKGACHWW
ncbi:MAG: ParB/RepB/Spo0J family partition protein, partial [Cyclobacteriaceae bacterium]|nr:ParB/RepB/Spo0J family partition protein [Cyclobacteriaceae bacterium]